MWLINWTLNWMLNRRHFIVTVGNMKQDKMTEWKVWKSYCGQYVIIFTWNLFVPCTRCIKRKDYRNGLCALKNVFFLFVCKNEAGCAIIHVIRILLWMRLAQLFSLCVGSETVNIVFTCLSSQKIIKPKLCNSMKQISSWGRNFPAPVQEIPHFLRAL